MVCDGVRCGATVMRWYAMRRSVLVDELIAAEQRVPTTVIIRLRDAAGNDCPTGEGAAVHCAVSPRRGHHGDYGQLLDLQDRGDGSFRALLRMGLSGKYTVGVTVGGEHICGSPFRVDVSLPGYLPSDDAHAVALADFGEPEARPTSPSRRGHLFTGERVLLAPGAPAPHPLEPRHSRRGIR